MLFRLLQQTFIHRAQFGIGFFQQVLHALIGGGERSGFRQLLESGHGLQLGGEVVEAVGLLCQHGGHDVLRVVVLQQHRQTRLHKVGHFGDGVVCQFTRREGGVGGFQHFADAQVAVHQHTQNAQSGTAQRVGVFVAGGNQADAPDAD